MHRSLAAGVAVMLMVEPIKPFRVRQTVAGGWQVMSDLPYRGVHDDRWWCIRHMVNDDRRDRKTLSDIARRYNVHPSTISRLTA
jgi:hypothetical protein